MFSFGRDRGNPQAGDGRSFSPPSVSLTVKGVFLDLGVDLRPFRVARRTLAALPRWRDASMLDLGGL
jgi:hypothetical protein